MRILSLLPAATEIVFSLGLEKFLVGVSGDCDFPPEVKKLPILTSSKVSNAMTSLEIDMAVKKLGHQGIGVFHIDQEKLKELKPDLILTQELCSVCAVGFNQVKKAARILDSDVRIISLEPESVDDILENIRVVGEYTGKEREATKVVRELKKRMEKVNNKIDGRKKVLVVEWLDPVMVAGHWVPQMIEIAGGKMLITKIGEKSRKINPAQLKLNPDIVIIAPCGFDIDRTIRERFMIDDLRLMIKNQKAKYYLVDGNSYMTRPGPRVVDGIEILAEILHPDIFLKKHSQKDWIKYK